MFTLPIPTQETGINHKHYIYIYTHYIHFERNNKFQFSSPQALVL